MSLAGEDRRVGGGGLEDRQPRAQVVEHLDAGFRVGDGDVHVHAAHAAAGGEVAEAFPHPVVPRRVDHPGGRPGGRCGADREQPDAGPVGGGGHLGPQPGHRLVQAAQLELRRAGHLDLAAHVLVLDRPAQLLGHLGVDLLDGLHGVRFDRVDQDVFLFHAEREQILGLGLLGHLRGDRGGAGRCFHVTRSTRSPTAGNDRLTGEASVSGMLLWALCAAPEPHAVDHSSGPRPGRGAGRPDRRGRHRHRHLAHRRCRPRLGQKAPSRELRLPRLADPDAAGRPRPRAPSAYPTAA